MRRGDLELPRGPWPRLRRRRAFPAISAGGRNLRRQDVAAECRRIAKPGRAALADRVAKTTLLPDRPEALLRFRPASAVQGAGLLILKSRRRFLAWFICHW